MRKSFDSENFEVKVYKYDLFPPVDWGTDIEDELRKQNALWNRLCVIEREHVAAVRAVGAPAVEALESEALPLAEKLEELLNQRRAVRKSARSKAPTPELDSEIEELKTRLKTLRDRIKVERKNAYAENKEKLQELDRKRFETVAEARRNSGLFWCNYNSIINSYERARGRALKTGRELHERDYSGEGRLVNQIQGGMTTARMTAELDNLGSRAHSQAAILPPPAWLKAGHAAKTYHKRGGKHATPGATLRIKAYVRDGEPRFLSFPFIMYRPLPEDGLIKEVVVTRRRQGAKFLYAVIFTVTKPKEHQETPTGGAVAINLGWRKIAAGLRVATMAKMDFGNMNAPDYTILGGSLISKFEEYERVQGARDNARNKLVSQLKTAAMTEVPVPQALAEAWAPLTGPKQVRSSDLVRLYFVWHEVRTWEPGLFTLLSKWYLGEGHRGDPLWKNKLGDAAERVRIFGEKGMREEQANRRRHFENARLYFYRMEARRLVGDAAMVILDEHNMAQTARKESILPPPARRQRFIAAPSVLRQAILNYCRNYSVEVRTYKGEGMIHARCGHKVETSFPDEVRQLCNHCVEYFDVDYNFCARMLRGTALPPQPRKKAA